MMTQTRGLTFDDVILLPGYNGIRSRQHVSTEVTGPFGEWKIPVVSSNMDTITEVAMAKLMTELGGLALLHRFCSVQENIQMFQQINATNFCGISIGIGDAGMERAEALIAVGAKYICVDVAHGHSKEVNRTIRMLREKFHDQIAIIAGNVATYAGADYLAAAGADMIKVGIGSGSVCSTRIKTGFGVPQLTALMDCSRVDRKIIADGGIKTPGDAVKALVAGADMVMLGGLLSATEETPGKVIVRKDASGKERQYKSFRGMASKEAQGDFMGGMQEWKTAEGVALEVPLRGSARDVIRDLMGGIRSGMTYCGASQLSELPQKAQFMEITPAARIEGTPHGGQWLAT